MSTEKIGIALPTSIVDDIEDKLAYGDSRSQRIRNLIVMALAAEEVMVERGYYHPNPSKRQQIVREALEQYNPDEGTVLS
jgi:hypothetical protein